MLNALTTYRRFWKYGVMDKIKELRAYKAK